MSPSPNRGGRPRGSLNPRGHTDEARLDIHDAADGLRHLDAASRLHPNRLGQYERGDRDGVDVRTLARIAAVYGRTTADYLVEVEA